MSQYDHVLHEVAALRAEVADLTKRIKALEADKTAARQPTKTTPAKAAAGKAAE
jgi:BMFP domain-containing protein YqiC